MIKNLDQKLMAELEADPFIQKLCGQLNKDNRMFNHAWVTYNSKKWFPILVEDTDTKIIGFDFNPGGEWGQKKKLNKDKISLTTLLALFISNIYQKKSAVRCKTKNDPDRNARDFIDLKFTPELNQLITEYRKHFGIITDNSALIKQEERKESEHPFSDHIIKALKNEAENLATSLEGFDGEEREAIAKYRTNQGKFRELLLKYWGGHCAVSSLSEPKLLIASHILPWSKSTPGQKGDPFNGLLLSVTWDSLFDKGLITFDDSGKSILDKLSSDTIECLGLNIEKQVINPEKLTTEHKQYLLMHRVLYGFQ